MKHKDREREREEGGGPACPSAPRQTQEIRFCFHPVIFSRASTPPRFVFVNDATSSREPRALWRLDDRAGIHRIKILCYLVQDR